MKKKNCKYKYKYKYNYIFKINFLFVKFFDLFPIVPDYIQPK